MPEPRATPRAVEPRVPFGVRAIDEMLDGGLMPHRPYLLVGPSGTGKTTLALEFLREGIRRGEPGLYVTVEDPPNEVRHDHRALGSELDRVDVFDAIPDVMRYEHIPFKDISSVRDVIPFRDVPIEIRKTPELTSVEVTIPALEQVLRTEVQRRGYVRLVIDSLTALQYFCMKGIEPMSGAQAFLRFLSQLRTTSLLTVESPLEDVETAERSLARGEIRLFRWELDGVTVRAVGVEKLRGSAHDVRLHPYRIGPHGVDINLDLTISRDTRRLVEPALAVLAPQLAPPAIEGIPEASPHVLGSVSAQVRDLVAVGVDIAPVRVEVEAALAAVRAGHPEESEAHVARISSLAISLAESLLQAPPAERKLSKAANEAFQRIVQRADAARGGVPPTRLPTSEVLAGQLRSVIDLLPPAAGSPSPSTTPRATPRVPPRPGEVSPVEAPLRGPTPATPSPPGSTVEPPVPPPPVPSPGSEAPPAGSAPSVTVSSGNDAESIAGGPHAPQATARVSQHPSPPLPPGVPTPSAATPESRTRTPPEVPAARSPALPRRAGRGVGASGPYPAPPRKPATPLVDGEPMPRPSPHASPRPGTRAALAKGVPAAPGPGTHAPAHHLQEPPPLPTLTPWTPPEPKGAASIEPATRSAPPPEPSTAAMAFPTSREDGAEPGRTGDAARPEAIFPAAAPTPRRRRSGSSKRASAARPAPRSGADGGAGAEGAPAGSGSAAPTRRRAPRKRKAPPVVAAMPETIPPREPEPPPSRPPDTNVETPDLPPESPP